MSGHNDAWGPPMMTILPRRRNSAATALARCHWLTMDVRPMNSASTSKSIGDITSSQMVTVKRSSGISAATVGKAKAIANMPFRPVCASIESRLKYEEQSVEGLMRWILRFMVMASSLGFELSFGDILDQRRVMPISGRKIGKRKNEYYPVTVIAGNSIQ